MQMISLLLLKAKVKSATTLLCHNYHCQVQYFTRLANSKQTISITNQIYDNPIHSRFLETQQSTSHHSIQQPAPS